MTSAHLIVTFFGYFVLLFQAEMMDLEAMLEAVLMSAHRLNLNVSSSNVNQAEGWGCPPLALLGLVWYTKGCLAIFLALPEWLWGGTMVWK